MHGEMIKHAEFYKENLKEKDHEGDLSVDSG
jgi:hypothetical protein